MPFRDPTTTAIAGLDPLARFFELEAAFEAGRWLFGDKVPLRLAAANLVLTQGEPADITKRVRARADEIEQSMLPELTGPQCLLISAILLRRGFRLHPFADELTRVRSILRAHEIPCSGTHGAIAILVLWLGNELVPLPDWQIERLRTIYEEMTRHQRVLTGPEDLPSCALLASQRERSPEQIGLRARLVYDCLRERGKLWGSDGLQIATNLLSLSPLEPAELVDRFITLKQGFAQHDITIQYNEITVLCFLARPSEKVVDTVREDAAMIGERLRWIDQSLALVLAANLAFVHLVGNDPLLGLLADAKALLDMQAIINLQQAGHT